MCLGCIQQRGNCGVPDKKKKVPNTPACWNYISHWGVNMQTQSLICHFINITASVRWPTLLFFICVVVNKGSFVCVWCKQNMGEHPRIPTERNRCGFLSAQDKTQTDKLHNAAFLCLGYLKHRRSQAGCFHAAVTQNQRIYSHSSTTFSNWHQSVSERFFSLYLLINDGLLWK